VRRVVINITSGTCICGHPV